MVQETFQQQNGLLDQNLLTSQLTKIAYWMRDYEERRFDEEHPRKLPGEYLPESDKTPILSEEGYCFGLSALLIHCVTTEDQIEYKKQHGLELRKDPYNVDQFYERIREVNSCTIPPPAGLEKAFYEKMNIFMLELVQLQALERKEIPAAQIMEHILNEASGQDNRPYAEVIKSPDNLTTVSETTSTIPRTFDKSDTKKSLHRYFFTDSKQFFAWTKQAKVGDTLSIYIFNHAMTIYVHKNRKGKVVVGVYDANSNKRVEIPPRTFTEKHIQQAFAHYFRTSELSDNVFICEHFVHGASENKPIKIDDTILNLPQMQTLLSGAGGGDFNKYARKIFDQIEARVLQQDPQAFQDLQVLVNKYYDKLKKAGINYDQAIKNHGNSVIGTGNQHRIKKLLEDFQPEVLEKAGVDVLKCKRALMESSIKNEDHVTMMELVGKAFISNMRKSAMPYILDISPYMKDLLKFSTKDNGLGPWMLRFAASTGKTDIVKELIAKNLDVNNAEVATPLYCAMQGRSSDIKDECAIALIKAGASIIDIDLKEKANNHINDKVLAHTISLYHKDNTIGPLLMKDAVKCNDIDSIQAVTKLLDAGMGLPAEVRALDIMLQRSKEHPEFGQALLFAAVKENNISFVKSLLENDKLNITAKDKEGKCALDYAAADMKSVLEPLLTAKLTAKLADNVLIPANMISPRLAETSTKAEQLSNQRRSSKNKYSAGRY